MENKGKKTSIGRQRIEIKKIEKSSQLQVTFSKRRTGIFKKAGELSVLCGAEVAIIVTSPAGKIFAFGSPSADSVIDRFLEENPTSDDSNRRSDDGRVEKLSKKYMKAVGKLEAEKEREKAAEASGGVAGDGFWWVDKNIDDLGLQELEQYMDALELLKRNVMNRADKVAAATGSPSNFLPSGGAMAYPFGSTERNGFDFDRKPF